MLLLQNDTLLNCDNNEQLNKKRFPSPASIYVKKLKLGALLANTSGYTLLLKAEFFNKSVVALFVASFQIL